MKSRKPLLKNFYRFIAGQRKPIVLEPPKADRAAVAVEPHCISEYLTVSVKKDFFTKKKKRVVSMTKKNQLALFSSLMRLYEKSGQPNHPVFDSPADAYELVKKLHKLAFNLYQRDRTEPTKHKFRYRKLRHHLARRKMTVPVRAIVPMLRPAMPHVFMQGFLRKRVPVAPYTPMYSFGPMHKVNVYKNPASGRFDVFDANCNIEILLGITKRELMKNVQW